MDAVRSVLFVGSKKLGLEALRTLHELSGARLIGAVTLRDSNDTRSVLVEFERFCEDQKLPLHVVEDRAAFRTLVQRLRPDLCLVVGWYWIIDAETLAVPRRGFVGFHNSLLPAYRGGAPLVWGMIAGDRVGGTTLFTLGEGMDDGPVWGQASFDIGPEDYIGDVLLRAERAVLTVLREQWLGILSGEISPAPQVREGATYCGQRQPSDGAIDWTRPARAVFDFVRAQSTPYPGAYTLLGGKVLRIWRARVHPQVYHGTPGQVLQSTADGVLVACGAATALLVEKVQIDGDEEKPAQQVLTTIKTRFPPAAVAAQNL